MPELADLTGVFVPLPPALEPPDEGLRAAALAVPAAITASARRATNARTRLGQKAQSRELTFCIGSQFPILKGAQTLTKRPFPPAFLGDTTAQLLLFKKGC
jgi:hypothetical protein